MVSAWAQWGTIKDNSEFTVQLLPSPGYIGVFPETITCSKWVTGFTLRCGGGHIQTGSGNKTKKLFELKLTVEKQGQKTKSQKNLNQNNPNLEKTLDWDKANKKKRRNKMNQRQTTSWQRETTETFQQGGTTHEEQVQTITRAGNRKWS